MPGVAGIAWVVQVRRSATYILQLDKFVGLIIDSVAGNQEIGGTIIDFADDNGTHQRSAVRQADPARAQRVGRLGHKVLLAGAVNIAAKGDPVFGCAIRKAMSVASKVDAVAGEEPHIIALGTEGKAARIIG